MTKKKRDAETPTDRLLRALDEHAAEAYVEGASRLLYCVVISQHAAESFDKARAKL